MNIQFFRWSVVVVLTWLVLTVLAVEDEPAAAREAGRNGTSHTTWETNSDLNISTTADKSESTTDVSIPTTEQDWSPFPPGDVLNNPSLRKIRFCVVLCFNETKLQGLRNLWPYLQLSTFLYPDGRIYSSTQLLNKAKEIARNVTLRSKTYCYIVAYPIWEHLSVQCFSISYFERLWNNSPLGMMRDNIPLSVFNATLAFLSMVLGIFGNILIIIAVLTKKELKSSTNLILVGMAVADCLNSVTIVFNVYLDTFLSTITNPVLGPIGCGIVRSLQEFSQFAAVNHLITLSFERYFAICWPMKTNLKFTKKKTILAIIVNWLIAVAQLVPYVFLNVHLRNVNYAEYMCHAGGVDPIWIFSVFNLTIYLGLPVPILCFNYICVVRSLLTSIKRSRQMTGDSSQQTNAGKARLKLIYMMITLVVIYVLTVAPECIQYTLYRHRVLVFKGIYAKKVFGTTRLLRGMNSCTNVVVYALISRQFRTAFKDILCCCWKKPSGGSSGSGNQNDIEETPAITREDQV